MSPSLDHGLAVCPSLSTVGAAVDLCCEVVSLRLAIAELRPTRSQEQDEVSVSGEGQDRVRAGGAADRL